MLVKNGWFLCFLFNVQPSPSLVAMGLVSCDVLVQYFFQYFKVYLCEKTAFVILLHSTENAALVTHSLSPVCSDCMIFVSSYIGCYCIRLRLSTICPPATGLVGPRVFNLLPYAKAQISIEPFHSYGLRVPITDNFSSSLSMFLVKHQNCSMDQRTRWPARIFWSRGKIACV